MYQIYDIFFHILEHGKDKFGQLKDFAGIFQRLVEDSGRSYHLNLVLKKNMDLKYMNKIRNRINNLIKRGISIPYPWTSSYCDLELYEIKSRSAKFDIKQISAGIKRQLKDPLYQEFVPIEDYAGTAERVYL